MTFNPNAQLDPSQVEDVRGQGSYGGLGGRGVVLGGGGAVGIIVTLLYVLLGGNIDVGSSGGSGPGAIDYGPGASQIADECKTGADANKIEDCRIVGYINSIQAYWKDEFAQSNGTYQPATTVLFSGSVDTGCGPASTEVGPFYCPEDEHVYLDLGFFQELQSKFGAKGGPFAEAYVVAHEYGHHIQDLTGTLGQASGATGASGGSVRIELQADCYAGIWANHAVSTGYIQSVSDQQIADALDAAGAVGDDRIQSETQGHVNPESWTHGSSAQREHWFTTGYRSGSPADCDTLSGPI